MKMTSKEALQQLNHIPEGKPPWLGYSAYRKLQALFEALQPPAESARLDDEAYLRMHDFLKDAAGVEVPNTQAAVHYNAFVLIRRGYRAEELTEIERLKLTQLMAGTEPADIDDLELHDFGNHRALYEFLTVDLGLFVEAGRGPVWHRAKWLMKHYALNHPTE